MQAGNYSIALFRLPFRALFLFAGIFSVLAMGVWGMYWFSPFPFAPFGGIYWWHGHEMVFGFAGAILVGFLLTAARTWTGLPGVDGIPLIFLVCFWLFARILLVLGGPALFPVIVIFPACFWILSIYIFASMILKVRMWRNMILIPVLLFMAILDVASIRSFVTGGNHLTLLHGGVLLMLLALTIIGGRVLPFFTSTVTGAGMVMPKQWIDLPIIVLTIGLFVWNLVTGLLAPSTSLAVALSLLALLHVARFIRWDLAITLSHPMLWSLHLAYLFLILGIVLIAGYHFGLIQNISAAFHAITIGAIGGMILSMTSRVSLGHTGRKIVAGKWLTAAFVLLALAALVRTFTPLFADTRFWSISYHVSACLWCIAYMIWLVKFLPVLIAPRKDGKPG